jgi:FAD/FMN-containing dehydrogenase
VAGFDLTRALIGSWGTLGCIVSASLRLRALPSAQEAWIVPAEAASRDAVAAFTRGPYAPIAFERIPAQLSDELGFSAEEHVVMWLAGSAVHVTAARSALLAFAAARQTDMNVWATIRARGPFTVHEPHPPLSDELRRLNARVRAVFDPHSVFVSPVPAMREEAVHV